jgi:hypothetical protein
MRSKNGCPFCQQHVIYIVKSEMPTAIDGLQVQCDNCAARGPVYEDEKSAVTGWELGILALGKRLRAGV